MLERLSGMLGNDSVFGRIFGKAGDLIITNLLFVICSLPIITLGASWTAMLYTFLEQRNGSDESVHRLFFRGFKANIKKSTLSYVLLLVLLFILAVDLNAFGSEGPLAMTPLYLLCLILMIMVLFVALWLFPVIAAYENSLRQLMIQSFYLAARNIHLTLLLALITFAPLFLTVQNLQILLVGITLWITFGFALVADLSSSILLKGFAVIPKAQEAAVEQDIDGEMGNE